MTYIETARSWDIFCRVLDNYGDIGVSWRLARQLAAEYRLHVRLWVDDLAAFRRICPEVNPALDGQSCRGVEVRRWHDAGFPEVVPADVAVEAFACELPESYVRAMAAREVEPRWINLEYLSAEEWVGECHGLSSPSPRFGLTKHFFFPGFMENTGGVPMERELPGLRLAFQSDLSAQALFWQRLGLPEPNESETRVSLFCYADSPVGDLFECWREKETPVTCLVPEGIAAAAIAAYFGQAAPEAGGMLCRGSLELRVLPFLEQDCYDRLLWACDCNFVRGEDSFLRAQWALRPLVWQPYVQSGGTHLLKLEAFLKLYCERLQADAAQAVRDLWGAWSQNGRVAEAWPAFWSKRQEISRHAEIWAETLRNNGDLAGNLVKFCSDKL